ncbi:MAG: 6-pyruvoyl trahydropterin synthase family protein, partial [Promethearchaeota archaeon]
MPFSVKVSDPRCKFSSTHFLSHHSKCSRLHGHNYQMMVEIGGDLDEHFFVVDFFDIKSRLIELANELDHAVLIPTRSDNIHVTEKNNEVIVEMDNKKYVFPRGDVR